MWGVNCHYTIPINNANKSGWIIFFKGGLAFVNLCFDLHFLTSLKKISMQKKKVIKNKFLHGILINLVFEWRVYEKLLLLLLLLMLGMIGVVFHLL